MCGGGGACDCVGVHCVCVWLEACVWILDVCARVRMCACPFTCMYVGACVCVCVWGGGGGCMSVSVHVVCVRVDGVGRLVDGCILAHAFVCTAIVISLIQCTFVFLLFCL